MNRKVNKWTYDMLQIEVNKYKTRKEFRNCNYGGYQAACYNKIINELFKNHENESYSYRTWTKSELQIEADKYKTRGELRKNNYEAYSASHRMKVTDELFKNHENEGYEIDSEKGEVSYLIYAYEFKEHNKVYVGLTNRLNRRDRDHTFDTDEPMYKFRYENNLSLPKPIILEDNLTIYNVQKMEKYWEKYYCDNNWETLNVVKTGSLGGNKYKWSKKLLQIEANKYKTRGDFQNGNSPAYNNALGKKLIDELFKNHENQGYSQKKVINGTWNESSLQVEADKYKTRVDFQINSSGAYSVALGKKLIDELFKNHENEGYVINNQKNNIRWTNDMLQVEADKYKTRIEFKVNNTKAYYTAYSKKIINELFKNHENQGYIKK